MKYFIVFISALFLTACATNTTTPPSVQKAIQPSIWKYKGITSYENNGPGLGSSRRYESNSAWVDVYNYDMMRSNWVKGVSDPQFSSHFDESITAIKQMESMGKYKNVVVIKPKDVVISNLTFRTVSFKYESNSEFVSSTTYLTALNGKLFKYRISTFEAAKENIDDLAITFIKENMTYLQDLVKIHRW